MDLQDLKTVAMVQGAFVLGVGIMIIYFYLRYPPKDTTIRRHVLLITASYMGLITATIISIDRAYYVWGDIWFWIVGAAYLLGDISLFTMFRSKVRQHFGTAKKKNLNHK